jgi:MFS family permease
MVQRATPRLRLGLPRTVVVLGLVSALNDAASEMVAPLLPLFLTATLGAGPAVVGLVEGGAEAVASVLKGVSGRLADRGFNAKRLVLAGYATSNAARPLIGLALGWGFVLGMRALDRVGKGLRTAPRDALIADSVGPRLRGRAFGFHRALDHGGAMVGPLLAFALVEAGLAMREVFFASLVPGVLVVSLVLWGLPDRPVARRSLAPLGWAGLDRRVRAMVLAAGGLAFAAVPEAFLVLWAHERGLALAWVPLVWAAASAAKFAVAGPAGMLADRWGRLPVLAAGWTLRVALLVALGASDGSALAIWLLFVAYAASLAATEGAERAFVADAAGAAERATAYGVYHMSAGLCALPGAVAFGAIWQGFGERAAFLTAAALTATAAALFVAARRVRVDSAGVEG